MQVYWQSHLARECPSRLLRAAPSRNPIYQLPGRSEKLLLELLEPNETVHVKLKGAWKEALVCTTKRVLILKAGYTTGQAFGSRVFQVPYRNVTEAQVKKHLLTGYFDLSAGVGQPAIGVPARATLRSGKIAYR